MRCHSLLLALSALCIGSHAGAAAPTSAYVGQETRSIKALSPSEVDDLLAGKGMGQARAAELNGYPGPMHVLELGRELALSDAQTAATTALFGRMQAAARALGAQLVEAERALDTLFKENKATPEATEAELARIGVLQARVRGVHLQAHLEQTRILSPEQVVRYRQLRGYDDGQPQTPHRHIRH